MDKKTQPESFFGQIKIYTVGGRKPKADMTFANKEKQADANISGDYFQKVRTIMEKEIYYYMETEDGSHVRVEKSQLKKWMEGQAAIKRGEKPKMSEESRAKLSKLLGIPEEK